MRVVGFVAAVLWIVVSAVPASAFNWSVGASLGANIVLPKASSLPNTVEFAWPFSRSTPGLRVGFVGEKPQHEFYLDTGLFLSTTKNNVTSSLFTGTANYQYNFTNESAVAPYLTAGGGIYVSRYKDKAQVPVLEENGTSGLFGGGIGVRHKMGNGHGVLRAEVRYDHLTEAKDGNVIVVDQADIVGFKLGFDLWDK
jgi:hypothetical protein